MLGKFQKIIDKINRTLEVHDKLQQVVGKAGFHRQVGPIHNQPIVYPWQWKRIYPGDPFRPRNIKFTGEEKILVPLSRNPTAQYFFKLYITEQIIDPIVIQTNLYLQFITIPK